MKKCEGKMKVIWRKYEEICGMYEDVGNMKKYAPIGPWYLEKFQALPREHWSSVGSILGLPRGWPRKFLRVTSCARKSSRLLDRIAKTWNTSIWRNTCKICRKYEKITWKIWGDTWQIRRNPLYVEVVPKLIFYINWVVFNPDPLRNPLFGYLEEESYYGRVKTNSHANAFHVLP